MIIKCLTCRTIFTAPDVAADGKLPLLATCPRCDSRHYIDIRLLAAESK